MDERRTAPQTIAAARAGIRHITAVGHAPQAEQEGATRAGGQGRPAMAGRRLRAVLGGRAGNRPTLQVDRRSTNPGPATLPQERASAIAD
jgi:hypothetical protein